MALHPKSALLNHSCDPNAFVRFDAPPTSSSQSFPPYGSISIHALRPIEKNEEVTISYVDTTFPYQQRQQELKSRYFFTCTCNLCAQGQSLVNDRLYLKTDLASGDSRQLSPQVIATGDDVEKSFLAIQSESGFEHLQIDDIKRAMNRLAKTGNWPLHRYPWPQLRHQLLLGLLTSKRFSEALAHTAIFVRLIHPVLFKQEHHPMRLVMIWTFWNICRYCLESTIGRDGLQAMDQRTIRLLGLLSCVLVEDLHRIMNDGITVRGNMEHMVDAALENIQREGGFWGEYQQKPGEIRNAVWSWVDDQLNALLKKEDVDQDIIDFSRFNRC